MSPSGIPHTSIHGVMSRYRTGRVRSLAPIRNQRRGSKQPRRWCRNVGNIPHSCHTTGRTHAPSFDCLRRWCVTGQAVHWFSLCSHPSPSRASAARAIHVCASASWTSGMAMCSSAPLCSLSWERRAGSAFLMATMRAASAGFVQGPTSMNPLSGPGARNSPLWPRRSLVSQNPHGPSVASRSRRSNLSMIGSSVISFLPLVGMGGGGTFDFAHSYRVRHAWQSQGSWPPWHGISHTQSPSGFGHGV